MQESDTSPKSDPKPETPSSCLERAAPPLRIITTLVMCGDNYVSGACILAYSIRERLFSTMPAAATAHYELWCMHTDDVSADAIGKLQKFFDRVVRVPYIIHPTTRMRSRKQEQIYGGWIAKSFTKWNIFDDTVFPPGSTVMLMDADMIVTDLNATVAVAPVVPATPRNDLLDVFDLVNDDIDGAATFSSPWCRPFANTVMVSPYNYAHGDIADPADIQC